MYGIGCTYHPNQEILFVCIAPHKCQRKLCYECLSEHNSINQQCLPINIFRNTLIEKIQNHFSQNSQDFRLEFKQSVSRFEKTISQTISDILTTFMKIVDEFQAQEQNIQQLLNLNPIESSYTQLEDMVQILIGNTLENLKQQRQTQLNKVSDMSKWLNHQENQWIIDTQKQMKKQQSNEQHQWVEKTEILKGQSWNDFKNKFAVFECIVHHTLNQEIQYYKDGLILRIDQFKDISKSPKVLSNFESIQNLQITGSLGKNNKKKGKWSANWNGENLVNVGGKYSLNGLKQGQWREIQHNHWSKANIQYWGNYIKHQRIGMWKYTYNNTDMGGGEYNDLGKKNGNWVELREGFWDNSQIILSGQYLSGLKSGRWNILWRENCEKPFELIGGGNYDGQIEGIPTKIGDWVETSDRFCNDSLVTYEGQYKKGKRIGQWNILHRIMNEDLLANGFQSLSPIKIGGGVYDEQVSVKIGKWIEESKDFKSDSQILYQGDYNNGKKFGRWEIIFYDKNSDQSENEQMYLLQSYCSGGGQYDEQVEGNSIKVGLWVELSDSFYNHSQVLYRGEYQNGNKIGNWDILWRKCSSQKFEIIGGGQYEFRIDIGSIKIGRWVEQSEGFCNDSQVISFGEYQNGQKFGYWDIQYKKGYSGKNLELIGGGLYELGQENISIKTGRWNEPSDNFHDNLQITFQGQYKNGKKCDMWSTFLNGQQIAGGSYEDQIQGNSIKVGRWVELSERFCRYSQICLAGQYIRGTKIGKWDILQRKQRGEIFQEIGGGSYDNLEQGNSIKVGGWIELCNNFENQSQVTFRGEYLNGFKVGRWDIYFCYNEKNQYIGGGFYFQKEKERSYKEGKWIELNKGFANLSQIILKGEYKDGRKIGKWEFYYNELNKIKRQWIGGGQYDEEQMKTGRWVELSPGFWKRSQIIMIGEYKKGQKIGIWEEKDLEKNETCFEFSYSN